MSQIPLLYYTDPRYLEHETLPGHAECPDRLRAITARLEQTGLLQDLSVRTPNALDLQRLAAVHSQSHLDFIEQMSPTSGLASVDPDTHLCPASLTSALLAAGAVVDATDDVLSGSHQRAFCAVRPPGHHAEATDAMGFCLFNSIAMGAAHALSQPGIERVAILDFDVHHGNGTVDIFRNDPRVLVCSSFQHPFYPHRMFDITRPNLVYTPLAAGTGSAHFRQAIERDWLPAIEAHQPQIVFVSAGFDAHAADPLAQLELTTKDFGWITEQIIATSKSSALGRIVSALEGGYELNALADSVALHVETLL